MHSSAVHRLATSLPWHWSSRSAHFTGGTNYSFQQVPFGACTGSKLFIMQFYAQATVNTRPHQLVMLMYADFQTSSRSVIVSRSSSSAIELTCSFGALPKRAKVIFKSTGNFRCFRCGAVLTNSSTSHTEAVKIKKFFFHRFGLFGCLLLLL